MLYKLFTVKRSEEYPITGPMIIKKVKYFPKELDLPEDEMLSFSKRWFHNLKVRHGICKLNIPGEIKSADETAPSENKIKLLSVKKKKVKSIW